MPLQDLASIYRLFYSVYGDSRLMRSPAELDAAIQASGLSYDQIGIEWLRALDEGWVYLDSDVPFSDDGANRAYLRIVSRMGA